MKVNHLNELNRFSFRQRIESGVLKIAGDPVFSRSRGVGSEPTVENENGRIERP
ncbi:hypothetical protein [Burkholderia contaminans]|uniref:hypothetical protein n=1 Tax=Burkholderia contaminans TaxID=488447 RepID=UPI001CF4DE53|nr:hypothetical protein [Burkholderia contaminans]MCA8098725.1 hypothetical protein [Burkholderia contaminans]